MCIFSWLIKVFWKFQLEDVYQETGCFHYRFYLPHGLTIDHEGYYWLTDVAMHQVFKFEEGSTEPLLTLGKKFEPARENTDKERFCKPTDVAVASNGDIFVSDGYAICCILERSKRFSRKKLLNN